MSDCNAGYEVDVYSFQLELAGKDTGINIEFTDVPGAYFNHENAYVKELINESHVLMLTIDMLSLMEDRDEESRYGPKHVKTNKVFEITNFSTIANHLSGRIRVLPF